MLYPKISDYIEFFELAKNRNKSKSNYVKFEEKQAELILGSLERKGIMLRNKKILDLGCGEGGYSKEFIKRSKDVIALDINEDNFQLGKEVKFVKGDARNLPFGDSEFDFVFCSSLIEHVKDQLKVIKEIERVLKKGGLCYLSFPPFWSPVGAHQFKPFHYLGERTAIKLSRKFYKVRSFCYDDEHGVLYRTTIKSAIKLIRKTRLKIIGRSTRFMQINFARIPILNEFLTWNVEFLLKK